MNSITLTKAEAIILHDILQNYHVELSPLIGQDMTAALDDPESAQIVADAASEFNYDDVEAISEKVTTICSLWLITSLNALRLAKPSKVV